MKKQIISHEDFFIQKLKEQAPYHGVIGERSYFNKDTNTFIEAEKMFVVIDENMQVIYSHIPFGKGGNYHKNVANKIKELKLNEKTFERFRTDNSMDMVISSLFIHFSLEYHCLFHKPYKDKDIEGKSFEERLEIMFKKDENLEELPSSKEFKLFDNTVDAVKNRFIKSSESRSDKDPIYAEHYTDSGKESLLAQIEWYKHNTSKTPIQDAFFNLLKARGVTVELKPFHTGCEEIPVMRPVSYISKEEIAAKEKADEEEFRRKFKASGVGVDLKKVLENLKDKE